jgi:tetrathionate reductase subunit B
MDPTLPSCPSPADVPAPTPPPAAVAGPACGGPSRRDFLADALKLAGGAYVLLAGGALAEGLAAPHAPGEGYDWTEHRYAFLVDTEKCIGCGSCARACAAENDVPDGFFRTWIERYAVGVDGSHVDSPNGGKDGFPPLRVGFEAT